MRPLISVIIPTYNHEDFISKAIDSVLDQTYKDLEIIVVDDGSTDNTRYVIKKYDEKVKYIFQANRGLASARNTGILASKGEFIAFLDADDIWLPSKLELQIELMLKAGSIGAVGCAGYFLDRRERIIGRFGVQNRTSKEKLLNKLSTNNIVNAGGSAILVRRECFEKVGLFDEGLTAVEDWDMWLRIAVLYEIKFVQERLVKIRMRSESMSAPKNAGIMLQNELKVLNRFFSTDAMKNRWALKTRSFSYRYSRAAWAFLASKNIHNARRCVLKSIQINPFYFLSNRRRLGLFVRIIFGDRAFNLAKSILGIRV